MAGNVAVFSPCVLPAVPFIVSSALEQHKWGPIAISLGLITSFTVIGMSMAMFGTFLGLEQNMIRTFSAWIMIMMGLIFVSMKIQVWMNLVLNHFASKANTILNANNLTGLKGQYFLGLLIGAVWSPCIGPTLGSALALAGQSESRLQGSSLIFIYGLGIIVPFLVMTYGTRHLGLSKPKVMTMAKNGKYLLGILMVGFGVSVITGLDKKIEGVVFDLMPQSFLAWITSF
jgi:cytochrome c biogenesis protein CcdA